MTRAWLLLFLPAAAGWAQTAPCTEVYGDQIHGSDLARALPAFRPIAPDANIAPAPLVGGTRVFNQPDLETIVRRFGLQVNVLSQTICFHVPTAPLQREAVLTAMRQSLPSAETRIELEDFSPEPVPPGTIQFPIDKLARPASLNSPALWRGEVVAGNRRFLIWARTRISAPVSKVVAVENLKPGTPIQPQQLRVEIADDFPLSVKADLPTIDAVTGMIPLRAVPAGVEIRMDNLVRPLAVVRGDLVHVEVRLGQARLSLNGRAETAGHMGDMVAIRNPESNRLFQARVEGKDSVLVDPLRQGAE